MALMADTQNVLREKLLIPQNYQIVFTSSATECWEIISQSLVRKNSQHFFNGAFGEKWADYAENLHSIVKTQFGINEVLPIGAIVKADVYCVTQNETSNATQVKLGYMKILREEVDGLIAVDVTSSFGGVMLDYFLADIWYGSVQKCLGLPAGMGFMILSPFAINMAEKIGENGHYNSLLRILDNAKKNQSSYTPNVLGIYLLNKTQKASKGIEYTDEKLKARYHQYVELFEKMENINFLIENKEVRSTTVLAMRTEDPAQLKTDAMKCGIVLGNGYGPWKSNTFRIANFPAIKTREVDKLIDFFERYC